MEDLAIIKIITSNTTVDHITKEETSIISTIIMEGINSGDLFYTNIHNLCLLKAFCDK